MAISITSHGWTALADRTYARRYASYDLTVGAVVGTAGILVVDTRGSTTEGHELRSHLRELSDLPVVAVVNTHTHFDHTLGNAAFDGVPLVGHESLADDLAPHLAAVRDATDDSDPQQARLRESPTRVPDVTFSSAWSTDLGDCLVEVIHPGPAHTGGDVVVKVVPDGVVFAGDLVEESGPPSYGDDCHPLAWGQALDFVVGLCAPDATVVPGHGDAVDRDFVEVQRQAIVDVANRISSCATAGTPIAEALEQEWPLDPGVLEHALRRGYAQLGGPAT